MNVLVVEDTPVVARTIEMCVSLRWPDSRITAVTEGRKAAGLVQSESPSFVVLDLSLPDVDGLEVLKEIRSFSDVPVLIVSGRDDEVTRVQGLETGADDYIVKPFSHTELLARIRAVLRRTDSRYRFESQDALGNESLMVDFGRRRVFVNGEAVELTATEWEFIAYAARNSGKILSLEQLAERVWGTEYVDPSAIKMCVYRLRQKLGDDSRRPSVIRTHRGLGYSVHIPAGPSRHGEGAA